MGLFFYFNYIQTFPHCQRQHFFDLRIYRESLLVFGLAALSGVEAIFQTGCDGRLEGADSCCRCLFHNFVLIGFRRPARSEFVLRSASEANLCRGFPTHRVRTSVRRRGSNLPCRPKRYRAKLCRSVPRKCWRISERWAPLGGNGQSLRR